MKASGNQESVIREDEKTVFLWGHRGRRLFQALLEAMNGDGHGRVVLLDEGLAALAKALMGVNRPC
jgi:hypothetical protein